MHIESKLHSVGTTIFTVMSSLANEHNAINLSQGFPDFAVDTQLIENVDYYMKGGYNQYPPMAGILPLREKISKLTEVMYNRSYNPESEITITSGATEALFAAITAIVNEGDEVKIFEPAYDSYVPVVLLNKGVPVFIPLTFPEYKVDWNIVEDKISEKTKLIILNFPHNPTGAILEKEDIKILTKLIHNKKIFLISDEVYEYIIFDGKIHQSIAMYPELAEKSFVISSFGKTFHITGWKVGYCQSPAEMSVEFRKIHQYLTFATSSPFQYALAKYLDNFNKVKDVKKMYENKRNHFLKSIKPSRFKPLHSSGTYFQSLDYSDITDEPDYDFAVRLIKEFGVASIPVSVFYNEKTDNKILRFCFAKYEDTLEKAAEKLCRI